MYILFKLIKCVRLLIATGIGEIYTVKQNEHTHVENIGVHDT